MEAIGRERDQQLYRRKELSHINGDQPRDRSGLMVERSVHMRWLTGLLASSRLLSAP